MIVVSFKFFLKSGCSCKKTNSISQDAGLLLTVKITKDTGLWKMKENMLKQILEVIESKEKTSWVLACIVLITSLAVFAFSL